MAAQEKKDLVDYSKLVLNDADAYQNKINEDKKEKEEATHFDNLDEEAMI